MGSNVSRDGRRVFFQSPVSSTGPLHVRIDGESTEALSISQRPGDPATPQHGTFAGASDDGTIVYFVSRSPLTVDAEPGVHRNLYRLDTESDELTLVTRRPEVGLASIDVARVWGVSPDGSGVYFRSQNRLTPDAPPVTSFGANVYHYQHGSGVRLVAGLPSDDAFKSTPPRLQRVSDNGRYLVFTTEGQPTGFDNADPDCQRHLGDEVRCDEVFVHDAVTGDLRCVSCLHDDGDNVDSRSGPDGVEDAYTPRAVLDDGTVFFTSGEALVPLDVNGAEDVYSWKDGVVSLVSSGRDSRGSQFADASADGRDVFFLTYERLVAADTDDELDMYDARVGGGIAAQQVPPRPAPDCRGDSCQGGLQSPPLMSAIGSLALSGRGDADGGRPVRASISLVRRSVRGTSFAVRVRVPGRGRIVAAGAGVRSKRKTVRRAATYRLRVSLTKASRQVLARRGRLRVRARVTFTPASGRPSVRVVAVTLRSPADAKAGSR